MPRRPRCGSRSSPEPRRLVRSGGSRRIRPRVSSRWSRRPHRIVVRDHAVDRHVEVGNVGDHSIYRLRAPTPADHISWCGWARETDAALRELGTEGAYGGFPGLGETDEDVPRLVYGRNYDRLTRSRTDTIRRTSSNEPSPSIRRPTERTRFRVPTRPIAAIQGGGRRVVIPETVRSVRQRSIPCLLVEEFVQHLVLGLPEVRVERR